MDSPSFTNKFSKVHSTRKQPSPEGTQPDKTIGLPFSGTPEAASKAPDARLAIFTLTDAAKNPSEFQASEFTQSNSFPTQCFAVRTTCLPSDVRTSEKLHPHCPNALERDPASIIPDSTISDADTFSTFDCGAISLRDGLSCALVFLENPSGLPSADH